MSPISAVLEKPQATLGEKGAFAPLNVQEGTQSDGFDLNVSLLEVSDAAGLTILTDDNCGSSCGACVTFTD